MIFKFSRNSFPSSRRWLRFINRFKTKCEYFSLCSKIFEEECNITVFFNMADSFDFCSVSESHWCACTVWPSCSMDSSSSFRLHLPESFPRFPSFFSIFGECMQGAFMSRGKGLSFCLFFVLLFWLQVEFEENLALNINLCFKHYKFNSFNNVGPKFVKPNTLKSV